MWYAKIRGHKGMTITVYVKFFKHQIIGPFCCQVGQSPKLIGYYAANLNSAMPTVKSAKPNARLLAFMFLAVTSCQLDKLHISLHVRRS